MPDRLLAIPRRGGVCASEWVGKISLTSWSLLALRSEPSARVIELRRSGAISRAATGVPGLSPGPGTEVSVDRMMPAAAAQSMIPKKWEPVCGKDHAQAKG